MAILLRKLHISYLEASTHKSLIWV